jgi:hypothetical protein
MTGKAENTGRLHHSLIILPREVPPAVPLMSRDIVPFSPERR